MGGGNMLGAIDRHKEGVTPVGITLDGRWVRAADEQDKLKITAGELPSVEAVAEPGTQVVPWADRRPGTASAPAQIPPLLGEVGVVLPILHGPFGEDGTIQGLLGVAGGAYSGPGGPARAAGLDKGHRKNI